MAKNSCAREYKERVIMSKSVAEKMSIRKPGILNTTRHRLWYNNVQGFAYMQIVGELGMGEVSRLFSVMDEVFSGKKNHNLLIDVRLSKGLFSQKEVRDNFKKKSLDIGLDRIAVLGASYANRMTLKILLSVLGKRHVSRFCTTEKDAMIWLKEDR